MFWCLRFFKIEKYFNVEDFSFVEYFAKLLNIFWCWIFFHVDYFSILIIFPCWLFFQVDYFSMLIIFPYWIFSMLNNFDIKDFQCWLKIFLLIEIKENLSWNDSTVSFLIIFSLTLHLSIVLFLMFLELYVKNLRFFSQVTILKIGLLKTWSHYLFKAKIKL